MLEERWDGERGQAEVFHVKGYNVNQYILLSHVQGSLRCEELPDCYIIRWSVGNEKCQNYEGGTSASGTHDVVFMARYSVSTEDRDLVTYFFVF